jgi:SpoVK/Ycf46/Vps4 family AAA+-type ATPase
VNDRNTKKKSGPVSGIGPGTVSGIGSTSNTSSSRHKQLQSVDNRSSHAGVGVFGCGDRSNICVDIEAERAESVQSVPCRDRGSEGQDLTHDGDDEDDIESEDEDGDGGGRGVVVIAATNRLEDLDPAVVRRFESKVYVGVPEHDTRVAMIVTFLR